MQELPRKRSRFTPAFQAKAVVLSQIMLLSPILLGLSNLFGTITQLFQRFFIFSISPIFYNLGIIFGAVVLYPIFGIYGLAYGVILGAFMHFFIQALASGYCGFKPKLSFSIDFKNSTSASCYRNYCRGIFHSNGNG